MDILKFQYSSHLFSSEYNNDVYVKAPSIAHSFHELNDESPIVGIAALLPEWCLLIQQYFDIVDYIDSL